MFEWIFPKCQIGFRRGYNSEKSLEQGGEYPELPTGLSKGFDWLPNDLFITVAHEGQSWFLKKLESELQNKTESQFQNKRESHFQNKTKSQF